MEVEKKDIKTVVMISPYSDEVSGLKSYLKKLDNIVVYEEENELAAIELAKTIGPSLWIFSGPKKALEIMVKIPIKNRLQFKSILFSSLKLSDRIVKTMTHVGIQDVLFAPFQAKTLLHKIHLLLRTLPRSTLHKQLIKNNTFHSHKVKRKEFEDIFSDPDPDHDHHHHHHHHHHQDKKSDLRNLDLEDKVDLSEEKFRTLKGISIPERPFQEEQQPSSSLDFATEVENQHNLLQFKPLVVTTVGNTITLNPNVHNESFENAQTHTHEKNESKNDSFAFDNSPLYDSCLHKIEGILELTQPLEHDFRAFPKSEFKIQKKISEFVQGVIDLFLSEKKGITCFFYFNKQTQIFEEIYKIKPDALKLNTIHETSEEKWNKLKKKKMKYFLVVKRPFWSHARFRSQQQYLIYPYYHNQDLLGVMFTVFYKKLNSADIQFCETLAQCCHLIFLHQSIERGELPSGQSKVFLGEKVKGLFGKFKNYFRKEKDQDI